MYQLEVDFDVYKALTLHRATEEVTYNDVLREILGLGQTSSPVSPRQHNGEASAGAGWITKGVRFPEGTEFRATHKGTTYTGRAQRGALEVEGKSYTSPSAAAVAITGNPVNGWRFWECRFPGKTAWTLIASLRSS